MILRPRCAERSHGRAHDRRRLVRPRAVAVGPRRPVDRVLKPAGNGIIVFRRDEQNRVGFANALFQLNNLNRRLAFIILAENRNTIELEDVDDGIFGSQLLRRPQRRSVIGLSPQAAGDTEYADGLVHFSSLLFIEDLNRSPLSPGYTFKGASTRRQILETLFRLM